MVKFKFLKKGIKGIKCFMKKSFSTKPVDVRVKRDSRNINDPKASVPSASSAEGFIPLAARDSQWVGIQFYNPNFRSPFDEDDDAQEAELHNLASDDTDAILLLFPGLNKTENALLKDRESSSTTEITKLLVGQKADFRNMKSSRKLLPTDNKLSSVPEMPMEERNPSETDLSAITPNGTPPKKKNSLSDLEVYDDDENPEPQRSTHQKKRKKKSDLKLLVDDVSSVSIIEIRKKPSSKLRQSSNSLKEPCTRIVKDKENETSEGYEADPSR